MVNRFWNWLANWLREEPRGIGDCINHILIGLTLALAWMFAVIIFWDATDCWSATVSVLRYFPMALAEELAFRWIPLAMLIDVFHKKHLVGLIAVSLVASAVFGLCHGHYHNLYLQGVSGFLWSLYFIKFSTAASASFLVMLQSRALLATTLMHAFYNIVAEPVLIMD